MTAITWLDAGETDFPPVSGALDEPNGLLAAGGDLSPPQLLSAYRNGIFPWYSEGQPILWWSPSPRLVLFPERLHTSKSMAKLLRKNAFRVTTDQCFEAVMRACASPRADGQGTWISDDIVRAYCRLHQLGFAHSIEVWREDALVGGLYGVAMGRVFFGESMFSRTSNASKYGFIVLAKALQQAGFAVIDCQVYTDHLNSLGASEVSRSQFQRLLADEIPATLLPCQWPPTGMQDNCQAALS